LSRARVTRGNNLVFGPLRVHTEMDTYRLAV
jgi:hypothetical protein